jgi:hypothetical protein
MAPIVHPKPRHTLTLGVSLAAALAALLGFVYRATHARELVRFALAESEGAGAVEDSRACFGSAIRLTPGEHASWHWPEAAEARALAVWSADEVQDIVYELDGQALPARALAPGWNRIAEVAAGNPVELRLIAGDRGASADAAALAPRAMSMTTLTQLSMARELDALHRDARTDWSTELAAEKHYPKNEIAGCSPFIPADDVCPSWRIGDADADDTWRKLWNRTYAARGYIFDPLAWNAATLRCKGRKGLDASACLSCSAALPDFVQREGIVPVGVYHPLWCSPFAGGQCGACMKIRFPPGDTRSPKCGAGSSDLFSHCPRRGELDYPAFAQLPGEFEVRVHHDADGAYVIGYVTEWFDNVAGPLRALPFSIDFATHTGELRRVGNFPVEYSFVDCPTGDEPLAYVFSYEGAKPEGMLPWIKLRPMNAKRPIERLEVRLDGQWIDAKPLSDGHFELARSVPLDRPLGVRTTMFGGEAEAIVREVELVPSENLCAYQDPDCRPPPR